MIIGVALILVGSLKEMAFWWNEGSKTFIRPITCSNLTVVLRINNPWCKSQAAHDWD